ncbi:MAG: SpoVR family protein [Chitinispirillaceae bacterium]
MELIDQKTKAIMEGCKRRAYDAGLRFGDETLEYIVSNRDLIELSPKLMIPTMYDYWVHDVEVLKEKGRYELYPSNPYETVINTRPAISFYNDNNPDWMNVMIFYHVLAHIDFFNNNNYFSNTWDYDFTGHALSDKRLIAKLRSEKGRWVDYIIEFARGIDNMVGYFNELSHGSGQQANKITMLDYYFDVFLQTVKIVSTGEYVKELKRYNEYQKTYRNAGEKMFFAEVFSKNPEFESLYKKHVDSHTDASHRDLLQYILDNSDFLSKDENRWMKSVIEVVRKTSLYFQPQIRTKIMNEGWASYWHEKLFLADDRITGHEVDFARTHAGVASLPRVGLNPYALGLRMFYYIEDLGNTGRHSLDYRLLSDSRRRENYDTKQNCGRELIFEVRRQLSDSLFIDTFLDQDFVNRFNLFVAGKRLNRDRMVWEYYVKSRKAQDYRAMVKESLYHTPYITVDPKRNNNGKLYLVHHFEEKPLVHEYLANTMLGIEYLWGGPVQLETSEVVSVNKGKSVIGPAPAAERPEDKPEISWRRVLYTMRDKKLSKQSI